MPELTPERAARLYDITVAELTGEPPDSVKMDKTLGRLKRDEAGNEPIE